MELLFFSSLFIISSLSLATMITFRLWELGSGKAFAPSQNNVSLLQEELIKFLFTNYRKRAGEAYAWVRKYGEVALRFGLRYARKIQSSNYLQKKIAMLSRKGRDKTGTVSLSPFFKTIREHRDRVRKENGGDANPTSL